MAPDSEKSNQDPGSLAAAAGDQVRAIIGAAESTAAEIRAAAQRDAQQIAADARAELKNARDQAANQASAQVAKVSDAGHVDARADRGALAGDRRASGSAPVTSPPGCASSSRGWASWLPSRRFRAPRQSPRSPSPRPSRSQSRRWSSPRPRPNRPLRKKTRGAADEDVEGARLIALNMALNGSSREEIDSYLQENFDLKNRAALLDEVYASVEG